MSVALDQWAHAHQVELQFIEPGNPIQNAFIESFNGKFGDECLNESWFVSVADAQQTTPHVGRPHDRSPTRGSALSSSSSAPFAATHCGGRGALLDFRRNSARSRYGCGVLTAPDERSWSAAIHAHTSLVLDELAIV